MDKRVCVLRGGESVEREISLKSGRYVEEALKEAGYSVIGVDPIDSEVMDSLKSRGVDLVFIALHGPGGEDGVLQGWLETVGIPYTGSGVLASALAMDKSMSRRVWKTEGLNQPNYQIVRSFPFVLEISLPLIVKPARCGSTIGVNLVRKKKEVEFALKEAFKYDNELVIIEDYIEGREITVGIVDDPEPRTLPVIEIISQHQLYDYHNKYTKGMSKYLVPAPFSPDDGEKIQKMALKAYKTLGCRDFGRVDMMWRNGEVYILEVNTIPGMTNISLLPCAAKAEGIEFYQLVDKIVRQALKRESKSIPIKVG